MRVIILSGKVGKIVNILESCNFQNQYNFFEEYEKTNVFRSQEELKIYFEKLDQEIFNSSWRKSMGYIPDGFKSRTILTIYGAVTFKRRVYKYWNNNKYKHIFLVDKKLQINKYSRVSSHLKFKVLEQIACGKRQRDICDMFYHANLSRATISNLIQSVELSEPLNLIFDDIEKIKIPKHLYINMDETFVKLWIKKKMKKYRIRLVTFHTGYNKFYSTEKRKVLDNKRVYWVLVPVNSKINTAEFMADVEKMANKFYSNVNQVDTIIGGDGAPWIRNSPEYFPNSFYVLDKFHACRYLKRLFPTRKNELNVKQYENNKTIFETGNHEFLISNLKQSIIKPEKNQKLKEIVRYFQNNKLGITNQSLEWNIGVSAEGDISHIVKWLLGYGSKAFNYKTFNNMLLLRTAQINNLDILTYLKNDYQREHEHEKRFYWSSYWIKTNNDFYDYPCQGSLPGATLGKGKSKWINGLLNQK